MIVILIFEKPVDGIVEDVEVIGENGIVVETDKTMKIQGQRFHFDQLNSKWLIWDGPWSVQIANSNMKQRPTEMENVGECLKGNNSISWFFFLETVIYRPVSVRDYLVLMCEIQDLSVISKPL